MVFSEKLKKDTLTIFSRYEILQMGSFQEVEFEFDTNAGIILKKRMQTEVDKTWKHALIKAKKEKIRLFNGPLYRLISHRTEGRKIILRTGSTNYKEYIGTNVSHPEWYSDYGMEFLANPLALSVVITTADNLIVLGSRSGSPFEESHSIHVVPAGHFTPLIINNKPAYNEPLLANDQVKKELIEELGQLPVDDSQLIATGLIRTLINMKPEVTFHIPTLAKWSELLEISSKAIDAWEHKRIFSIKSDPDVLHDFLLKKRRTMVPAGHAALLLYAKKEFGDKWYKHYLSSSNKKSK